MAVSSNCIPAYVCDEFHLDVRVMDVREMHLSFIFPYLQRVPESGFKCAATTRTLDNRGFKFGCVRCGPVR